SRGADARSAGAGPGADGSRDARGVRCGWRHGGKGAERAGEAGGAARGARGAARNPRGEAAAPRRRAAHGLIMVRGPLAEVGSAIWEFCACDVVVSLAVYTLCRAAVSDTNCGGPL